MSDVPVGLPIVIPRFDARCSGGYTKDQREGAGWVDADVVSEFWGKNGGKEVMPAGNMG